MLDLLKHEHLLHEAGTFYTFELRTAQAHGFARMLYRWRHESGAAGSSAVYCNPGELLRLLDRWNGQHSKFKYST